MKTYTMGLTALAIATYGPGQPLPKFEPLHKVAPFQVQHQVAETGSGKTLLTNKPYYTMSDTECLAFLADHPKVSETLDAARLPLLEAFGKMPNVDVRITKDEDSGERFALAGVSFPGDVEEGVEMFWRFKRHWLYEHVSDADFLLVFMFEKHAF